MLALAANDITINASASIKVTTSITISGMGVVFENTGTYTPVDGVVSIGELGELCNRCIQLSDGFNSFGMEQGRYVCCLLTISLPDEDVSSSSVIWYCRKSVTGFTPPQPRFATIRRDRKLAEKQFLPLYLPSMEGLTVFHRMAFLEDGAVRYISDEEEIIGFGHDSHKPINASPYEEKQAAPVSTSAQLLFYDVELYHNGVIADRVHCEIDGNSYIQSREFLYLNMFGVQDSIILRGDEEETQEMEASFNYANTIYQKYDSSLTEKHKTNSGWVDMDDLNAVYDMVESPYVAIRDGNQFIPVVITEVEIKLTRPSNGPKAVFVTWRYADKRDMRRVALSEVSPSVTEQSVFEKPPFDGSFT